RSGRIAGSGVRKTTIRGGLMTGWSKGRRRRGAAIAAGLAAAIAVLLALPLTSLGSSNALTKLGTDLSGALHNVTSSVQSSVQKLSTTKRSGTVARSNTASPAQSSSTNYVPPGYGTNPHGQGTVGSVSLGPSGTRPYTYSPTGSSSQNEEVVIGMGRSEQQADGTYD